MGRFDRDRHAPPPSARILLAAVLLCGLPDPAAASRFAAGTNLEWWNADFDISMDPPSDKEWSYGHVVFSVPLTTYYLEEPGFLFSLISASAQTEANELKAREEAVREGRSVYSYAYAQPAPIPTGRWFRWGFASGEGEGGTVEQYVSRNSTGKMDSLHSREEPGLRIKVLRLDANLVTAPRLIRGSDFYWMVGSDMHGQSVKFNILSGGTLSESNIDWSFFSAPLNLHLGWNPAWFAWLMVEGRAGYDFIDPVGQLFFGFENYSQPYNFGAKATLGTDWISAYYSWGLRQEPVYNGAYNRRYRGQWNVIGARLDIGNLFAKIFRRP